MHANKQQAAPAEISKRDMFYNAVLEAVKEHGADLEIGLVRAVLAEVDGVIASAVGRLEFDAVCDRLAERIPRECGQHPRGTGQ